MKFNELKKYLGIFVLAVAIIIVYKTFDNFGMIIDFISNLFGLLTPFFIGAGIAFILRPFCKNMEILLKKTKVNFIRKYRRGFAVICVYVIVVAAIALIMTAIIPRLIESVSKFIEQCPNMLNSLISWINSLGIANFEDITIEKIFNNDFFSVNKFLNSFDLKNMDKYAKGVMSFGTSVINIFLGLIISVYMLLERKQIKRTFLRSSRVFLPEKFRKNLLFYGKTVGNFITRYIGCQFLDACIVFVLCLIVLSIMRTEYASVIALMVGSFNLIPYFGAFIAVLISALITFVTNGFMSAIILVIVLIVLQQIDANVIQPRLVASSLSIKPLMVIFGVLVGGRLFGIIGIFIGVPVVALIRNILTDIVDKKSIKAVDKSSRDCV